MIKLVTHCWNCNQDTLQEELFPVEEYNDSDTAFTRTQCLQCRMHNQRVFSISEYEKKRMEYEKAHSTPGPIH